MPILYSHERIPSQGEVVGLYRALGWSSADKPEALMNALRGSHSLVTAWDGGQLLGLGNAISDGHLVAYFPHLLVHPSAQGRGIGSRLLRLLLERYKNFHQQVLLADGDAAQFYERLGFSKGGSTVPMWIYDGLDHN